jgi:hypothetical protein
VNNDDNQLYLSFMREGAQGAWLTTIRFTPEPHRPALLLPLYHVLGKIARLLGLSNELAFHLARLSGGVLLLIVAYWLSTLCLPPGIARQSAFLLVCFSSGLGWLLALARLADRVIVPVDIRVPEASTFLTIMTSPHFVLGITLQLLTFIFYLSAGRHASVRPGARAGYLLAAALCLLLLSITLVYNVIVVAAALGGYALIRCGQQRRLWVPELWQALAVGAPTTAVIAYYYVLLRFDPFWRIAYGEHDVVRTPGLLALVLGYGLVFWLALWGLAVWAQKGQWSPPRILLVVWVASNGLLLYAPLAFQGKLAAGWHVGLSILAAVGLHQGFLHRLRLKQVAALLSGSQRDPLATLRNVTLILTVPSTLLVALVGFRVALAEHYFPYFLPVEDVQAVAWLETQTDHEDVFLASYAISNYGVAHSDARSFLGHQFAVIDPQGKDRALRHFYSRAASEEERHALVDAYGITFVYYGAHERVLEGAKGLSLSTAQNALSALPDLWVWPGQRTGVEPIDHRRDRDSVRLDSSSSLDHVPWLVPVYRQGETVIYRVQDEGEQT